MGGILSRIGSIFGGGDRQATGRSEDDAVVYQGLRIYPTPISEGGQWRLAAAIVKGTGEEQVEYSLIRADVFSSRDDAVSYAVLKAKQVINEQGERLFSGTHPRG